MSERSSTNLVCVVLKVLLALGDHVCFLTVQGHAACGVRKGRMLESSSAMTHGLYRRRYGRTVKGRSLLLLLLLLLLLAALRLLLFLRLLATSSPNEVRTEIGATLGQYHMLP